MRGVPDPVGNNYRFLSVVGNTSTWTTIINDNFGAQS